LEVAAKRLEPPDRVQKSYRVGYNGSQGFIVLTNRKIMVMEEKGFFRASYNVVLEIPYTKVKEVSVEGTHRLAITDTEGKKQVFVSFAKVTASIIEGDLKDLIKAVLP
jgi:hypothetical protein